MTEIAVIGLEGGWSSELLVQAFASKVGTAHLVDMSDVRLETSTGSVIWTGGAEPKDLTKLDGIFVKKIGPQYSPHMLDRLEILRFVEARGVPVFSRPSRIIRLLDRLACTVTLASTGIPMPETVVTEDLDAALDAMRRFGHSVLKPLYSTKARGMRMVDASDPDQARRELDEFVQEGNPVVYLQRRVELSGRDLGVVFLGGQYVGTYARVGSSKSWNTTIHDGGKYQPADPPEEWIELARKAQQPFELDFTCVDVAETPSGPVVFEVSAFGGFRGLHEGLGIDAADIVTNYVLERIGAPRGALEGADG